MADRFLFLDKETTGLDERRAAGHIVGHVPIEVAARILVPPTSRGSAPKELGRVSWPIRPLLGAMVAASEYALNMHQQSGLLEKAVMSNVHVDDAERGLLELIAEHTESDEDNVYLAGNSIHFDRRFIRRYMPKLEKRLHYRMLDITAVSLFQQLYGVSEPWGDWEKQKAHTADADLDETLQEAEIYARNLGLLNEG